MNGPRSDGPHSSCNGLVNKNKEKLKEPKRFLFTIEEKGRVRFRCRLSVIAAITIMPVDGPHKDSESDVYVRACLFNSASGQTCLDRWLPKPPALGSQRLLKQKGIAFLNHRKKPEHESNYGAFARRASHLMHSFSLEV